MNLQLFMAITLGRKGKMHSLFEQKAWQKTSQAFWDL